MKRIFILLLLSVAVMAADDSEYTTGSLNNGRIWTASTHTERAMYVAGLLDMMSIWKSTHSRDADAYTVHATVNETVKLLDSFYDDAANADVPVVLALMYAKARVGGTTATKLEELAAKMRAIASKLNEPAAKSSN